MPGPLSGLRVLELATLIAGPFAGRMLADQGAEVIKVEGPGGGDPLRQWGHLERDGRTPWWAVMARGKKLLSIDLHDARGQAIVRDLAARSDVLIENFRPGTLERFNLAPAQLLEANPRLVVARISGYGQTGRYAARAGFASASEAISGMRYINGYPGMAPPRTGLSLGDSLAAMHAVQGILMALHARDHLSGRGQVVDASIVESCFNVLDNTVVEYSVFGHVREPEGTRIGYAVPSNVYRSRDGRWVVVAANNDKLWRKLVEVMQTPEALTDPRFLTYADRIRHIDEVDELVGAWVGSQDAADADRLLAAAGIVTAPVYSVADIFEDPYFREREMLVDRDDPVFGAMSVPGVTPKLSETPGRVPETTATWTQGAHNREVLGALLGIKEEELSILESEGVL